MPTPQKRFDAKTLPEPNSGCVLWLGGCNEHGYGVFWNGTRLEKAHRFALRCTGIDIPDEKDVLHTCDVAACVNPAHLYVGDAAKNVGDMWQRGRATVVRRRGVSQAHAKLDDRAAEAIREAWRNEHPRPKQRDLAERYGISQRLVWNVIHGKNWFAPSGVALERGRRR